ncbi:hypothetical protein [Mesorhizobium sp. M9A.F.Ca.ET.002.03.1.2]|uniref:hypothetical protein n=1 Tax=Mesorhizobium sp. M9A.F.Ca.ET.002.03.1.2 TaxID=2493668 RepID=UPI0016724D19|nr:hypothetical protein [Mesorhizobium sp. M9A.F.Ca.ET.002.03.1.2]
MRQQKSAQLDLALGDDALPLMAGNGEAGKAGGGVDQEKRHDVDQALRLQALLKVSGGLQIALRDMARDHMRHFERRPCREILDQPGVDLGDMFGLLLQPVWLGVVYYTPQEDGYR